MMAFVHSGHYSSINCLGSFACARISVKVFELKNKNLQALVPWRGKRKLACLSLAIIHLSNLLSGRDLLHPPAFGAIETVQGFNVPEGFQVTRYADDSLAHDIYSMTMDSHGRVVVAGRGYVKILHDTDQDGRADQATLFSNFPKTGARGLYFDGNDLICSGDRGVRRVYDRNGDGIADGETDLWIRTETDGEHAANGIVRGPDGWYYLICANDAGIGRSHVTSPGSPVTDPVCGAVVRISPAGKTSEVYADGFRNPYGLDFNVYGSLFTYESDGEGDYRLPWYSPTRFFDIAQGMEHGWILKGWQHSWNRPEAIFDNVEHLAEVGRGSPTGVVVYRHHSFPERYQGGLFAACWSFGRIYFCPLERRDSTYRTRPENFMETTGDVGFAPVALAVGPEGDLFVAIGGRGTGGSVFRVRYQSFSSRRPSPTTPLRQVLGAVQPLTSWSRAQWVPVARQLGKETFELALGNSSLPLAERIRAIEILTELFGGLRVEVARQGVLPGEPELLARAVWAVGRSSDSMLARQFFSAMTCVDDARVARAAWEGLAALPSALTELNLAPDWMHGLDHPDRRVRAATVLAARGPGYSSFVRTVDSWNGSKTPRQELGCLMLFGPQRPDREGWPERYFRTCWEIFQRTSDVRMRLDAVRLLQLALGDIKLLQDRASIYDGFVGNLTEKVDPALRRWVIKQLAPAFPTDHRDLDRELGRLLGMLSADDTELFQRVASMWTDQSSVEDDIHYLIMAARLPTQRTPEITRRTARALVRLHAKMARDRKEPGSFWPVRVGELFDLLCERDPGLAAAVAVEQEFGFQGHELLAEKMNGPDKLTAVRKLMLAAEKREKRMEVGWTSSLAELVSVLPREEVFPVLRKQWEKPALRDAILLALAGEPQPEDWVRLVEGLQSIQPVVVACAAAALATLPQRGNAKELFLALEALRRLSRTSNQQAACQALNRLLAKWSGKIAPGEQSDGRDGQYEFWHAWFVTTFPREASRLTGDSSANFSAWKDRLLTIKWESGRSERGQKLFEERMCYRCHGDAGRLGPDLFGVAQRLSREDLFAAIVDPNQEVSPANYGKLITTKSGSAYTGFLVYDSPSVKLVRTGPDATVRLTGDEVVEVNTSKLSLMPSGLLDGLANQDLADLYAYLKTLRRE